MSKSSLTKSPKQTNHKHLQAASDGRIQKKKKIQKIKSKYSIKKTTKEDQDRTTKAREEPRPQKTKRRQ